MLGEFHEAIIIQYQNSKIGLTYSLKQWSQMYKTIWVFCAVIVWRSLIIGAGKVEVGADVEKERFYIGANVKEQVLLDEYIPKNTMNGYKEMEYFEIYL